MPIWELKGMCQLCDERPAVSVDHDHNTGCIRGNVCARCNLFAQNNWILRRALEWVENPRPDLPLYKDYHAEKHDTKGRAINWNKEHPERRKAIALDSYHRNKGEVRAYNRTDIRAADRTEYKREYKRRADAAKREAAGLPPAQYNGDKATCKNGHPFSKENTYMRPTGGRACRECNRLRTAAYAARKAAS